MKDFDYDKIYRYLNGEMQDAEATAFEQILASDEELSREVAFNRDLVQGITLLGDQQLAEDLHGAHREAEEQGLLFSDPHIVQYLNDELPADQIRRFENRLAIDEDFAKEVELQRDLLDSIELSGDESLTAQIRQTQERLQKEDFFLKEQAAGQIQKKMTAPSGTVVRQLFSRRNMAVAASVLLLITAGYFLLRPARVNQEVFASYYQFDQTQLDLELEELSLVGMATPDKARRESLKAALDQVQARQFGAAIDALRTHLSTFPNDEAARFFLGLSQLENGNLPAAARQLEILAQQTDSSYREDANWYLALTYLQNRDKLAEAEALLQQLTNAASSPYRERAEALLLELQQQ